MALTLRRIGSAARPGSRSYWLAKALKGKLADLVK
jgi:hypothetical protein